MKRIMQTKLYNKQRNERGDCLRASLASLLDLEITDFEHSTYMNDYVEKLPALGFGYEGHVKTLEELAECTGVDGNFVAHGMSSRGVGHAIVVDVLGRLMHDPHPSGEGIDKIKGYYLIERI